MEPISWQAYEYEHREKTSDWFWTVGIITVAISIVSLILGDILFALFILIAGFALALYATRHPQVINATVTEKSIRVNNTIFPFSEIKAFCVATEMRHPSIVLTLKKPIMPHVIIPLGDADIDAVDELLSSKLEEMSYTEPLFHKIFDAFGF